MRELCDAGKQVLFETSGEADVARVDPRVHKIMDLKAPGSGECHRNRWSNLDHLTQNDEIKFVLAGRADYEWMRDTIRERGLASKVKASWLVRVRLALARRAGGLGARGWARRARAAADAQVHLGSDGGRGLSRLVLGERAGLGLAEDLERQSLGGQFGGEYGDGDRRFFALLLPLAPALHARRQNLADERAVVDFGAVRDEAKIGIVGREARQGIAPR